MLENNSKLLCRGKQDHSGTIQSPDGDGQGKAGDYEQTDGPQMKPQIRRSLCASQVYSFSFVLVWSLATKIVCFFIRCIFFFIIFAQNR